MDYINKSKLTNEEILLLNFDYENRKKRPETAYLLLILLGHLFVHRFYIGPTPFSVFGMTYAILLHITVICFTIIGLANGTLLDYLYLVLDNIYIVIIALSPYLWLYFDLFRINQMVDNVNHKTERALLEAMKRVKE
jgi:hypothetical protein